MPLTAPSHSAQMYSANPFDLLGDGDSEDPSQLIASKHQKPAVSDSRSAKLPSKPLPPAQAVRGGRGGRGRGAGFVQNRYLGNRSANGYYGGVPVGNGVSESFRGGRNVGLVNGNAEWGIDSDRLRRRVYERRSRIGRWFDVKREGAGRGYWGTVTDGVFGQRAEEGVKLNGNAVAFEKREQREGRAADASKDKKDASNEAGEKEPEMTLEEYEKVREEKRKALLSMKGQERKVEFDKDLKAMQQLSIKKGNDDVFIKLGSDKDLSKRRENTEKEERARKAMTINEFLKPTEGERHYSPGFHGRGRGRGSFRGGYVVNVSASQAVPLIEDPAHFPTLSGK